MKEFIRQQIVPGFSATVTNKKVQKLYIEKLKAEVSFPENLTDQNKFTLEVENLIKNQLDRKTKLEDKAKSLLFIITLSVTTATFSLNFLKGALDNIISPLLAILSINFFVFAGIRIISAINIRMFHIWELSITHESVNRNESTEAIENFVVAETNDKEYIKALIHNKILNDLICTKIANLTYASFILVRNGLILFSCFFAFSILTMFFQEKEREQSSPIKFFKVSTYLSPHQH